MINNRYLMRNRFVSIACVSTESIRAIYVRSLVTDMYYESVDCRDIRPAWGMLREAFSEVMDLKAVKKFLTNQGITLRPYKAAA